MGLDTTHGAWHGAYSAFMRWRTKIAELAGIPLPIMEGFYEAPGGTSWDKAAEGKDQENYNLWPFNAHFRHTHPSLPVKWESLKPDPLHVLLYHSDCDGEIAPEDCGKIADRLEELMPLLPSAEEAGHIGNWKDKTKQFIDGCRAAAKAGEPLGFH
jgi:hypothetical protein